MKTSPYSSNLRLNQTDAEKLLWYKLRNKQLANCKFRRQHAVGEFVVDFVCVEKKLIIELDGGGHNDKTTKIYDMQRTKFLERKGYHVLRFWNNDILNHIDEALEVIYYNLRDPHPNPLPTSRAREIKV